VKGSFRLWQVSGLAISSVATCLSSPNVHSVDFASFQPLRSQHSPSRLVSTFCTITFPPGSIPHHPPNVNIPDTTSHVQLAKFFYPIWWELLWLATSTREALKHSEMVYLLCKFCSCAHDSWLFKIFKKWHCKAIPLAIVLNNQGSLVMCQTYYTCLVWRIAWHLVSTNDQG